MPEGGRFAGFKALKEETEVRQDKIVLATDFFDELRRLTAGSGK